MIITISGANFSLSNIGTLSTWTVSKSIGAGAEHSIPSYVDKNSAFNYTITLKEGYTFGTYSVTMGGQTITPTVTETSMTINIASVTGAIRIEVKTINSSTGEEEGGDNTGGDTPITTWYTDCADINLSMVADESNTSYGWTYRSTEHINAILNKPINAVKFVTNSASGTVTIGVAENTGATTTTNTLVKTFNKGNTNKEIVTVVFDDVITLTGTQRLIFEPSDKVTKRDYTSYYGKPSNAPSDDGFVSRIPKTLSSGSTAWRDNPTNSIGWSVGYVSSGTNETPSSPSTGEITWYSDYSSTSHSTTCSNDSGGWSYLETEMSKHRNKPINYVKFATKSPSGTVRVGKAAYGSKTVTDITTGSFVNNTGGVAMVEVELANTITLQDNEFLIFEPYTSDEYAFSTKAGKYTFQFTTSNGPGFLSRIPSDLEKNGASPWKSNPGYNIGWSIGYKQK